MKITGLGVYKGTTYEVELDYERKIYLHADIITDFGLSSGMELDRVQLKKIIYASNFRRAYQRALYLLDYRDYTSAQMREKLLGNYRNEALCDAVIRRLEEHRIIDDERYAEKAARHFVEVKRFGFYRALSRRFPYSIYYDIEDGEARVRQALPADAGGDGVPLRRRELDQVRA